MAQALEKQGLILSGSKKQEIVLKDGLVIKEIVRSQGDQRR